MNAAAAARLPAAVRYPAQALAYAAFAAVVGYFSQAPVYRQLEPGQALVRLSFTHAAQRREPCRQRTPEELAKLAPNMRAPLQCPRERAPLALEVEMDGRLLYRVVSPPTGLAHDGAATVYRRITVPAGSHLFRLRLSDNIAGEFNYVAEQRVEIGEGRVLLIDFDGGRGQFVFRS